MNKNKLKRLADYAVREGTEHTTDGRWSVSYDELYYHFGEGITDANENGKLLEEELRQREEINELIMTEDAIEMTYHLEHCPNCQQGGIAGALNLISLVGCNISMKHLRRISRKTIRRRCFLCDGGAYADQCAAPKQAGGNSARAL